MEENSESDDVPNERKFLDEAHQTRLWVAVQALLGQKQMLQQVKEIVIKQEYIVENILGELLDDSPFILDVSDDHVPQSGAEPHKDGHTCEEIGCVGFASEHQHPSETWANQHTSESWASFRKCQTTLVSDFSSFQELVHTFPKMSKIFRGPDEDGFLSRICMPCAKWWRRAERPRNSNLVARFVRSRVFESLCVFVISLNAVCIGWQADYARKNVSSQNTDFMGVMDCFFCLFYTMELALRIYVDRCSFFFGPDASWNAFDTLLVGSAVQDQMTMLFNLDGAAGSMSYLRVVKLMKMLKLLRMIRLMRMFRELRLIMNSIMGSVKAMLWSIILIFVLLYMFGIAFLQAVTDYLAHQGDSAPTTLRADMDELWGSLPQAILSLYMAVMNGEDWRMIAAPLWECGWLIYVVFLFFIGFYVCVIANTLTSLFVECTIENAERDQQAIIQMELEQKDRYIKMLSGWFEKLDVGETGTISLDNVQAHLESPDMLEFASRLEIEPLDIKLFFMVLTVNGKKSVDLETFVVGAIKLKGMAKSMDLMDLVFAHRQFVHDQDRFNGFVERRFGCIEESLAQILHKFRSC